MGIDPILQRGYDGGITRYGDFGLSFREYRLAVLELIPKRPHRIRRKILNKLFLADLYLVIACVQKNPGAFDVFYDHFRHCIKLAVFRTVRSLKEDALQQFFLELITKKLSKYKGISPLRLWLPLVARRHAIDWNRQIRGIREHPVKSIGEVAIVKDLGFTSELKIAFVQEQIEKFRPRFWRTFKSWKTREQYILLLRYTHECRLADIARLVKRSIPRMTRIIDGLASRIELEFRRSQTSIYSTLKHAFCPTRKFKTLGHQILAHYLGESENKGDVK